MRIPPWFNTVTPYLIVDGAVHFLDFLVHGLRGEEIGDRHMRGDRLANAPVRPGTSTVMVSEAPAEYPAMPGSDYLYVENADEAMNKAIGAGATKIMEVDNKPYNDRQGGVKDQFGNYWWISERLIEGPY